MLKTFEAYSLEKICYNFDVTKGAQYYDFLIDDILSCELDNCGCGMEFSLIRLDRIINAIKIRYNKIQEQGSELNEFENEILECLVDFSNDDPEALVYIKGW